MVASVSPKYFENTSGLYRIGLMDRACSIYEMIGTYPLMVMTFMVDSDASACTSNDFPHPAEDLRYFF